MAQERCIYNIYIYIQTGQYVRMINTVYSSTPSSDFNESSKSFKQARKGWVGGWVGGYRVALCFAHHQSENCMDTSHFLSFNGFPGHLMTSTLLTTPSHQDRSTSHLGILFYSILFFRTLYNYICQSHQDVKYYSYQYIASITRYWSSQITPHLTKSLTITPTNQT